MAKLTALVDSHVQLLITCHNIDILPWTDFKTQWGHRLNPYIDLGLFFSYVAVM